jgi:tRNA dimethylallyltransferase
MCGGTGLYVRAVCEGIDEFPEVDESVKQLIRDNYKQFGIEWLQNTLKEKDKVYFHQVDLKNPYRLTRALEVCLQTNLPYSSFRSEGKKVEQFFDVIKIGLQMPREILYQRINERVGVMIQNGLEQEVRSLYEYKHLQALHTVGYAEWFDFFENKNSKETTIELIKQNTRHYAKRQITWFSKEKNLKWMDAEKINEMILAIEKIKMV